MTPKMYILFVATAVAAATDMQRGLIYNWLTIPAILAGICLSIVENGYTGLAMSLAGLMIGGGLMFIPFCFGVMGGGDVKLMAAIGALAGPSFVLETLLMSVLFGGVYGFGLMIVRGRLKPTLLWYVGCLKAFTFSLLPGGIGLVLPKSPEAGTAPFGVCIFLGVLVAAQFDVLFYLRLMI